MSQYTSEECAEFMRQSRKNGVAHGRRLERIALKKWLVSEMTTTSEWIDGNAAIRMITKRAAAKRGKG